MKLSAKILALAMAAAMSITMLASCGGDETDTDTNADTNAETGADVEGSEGEEDTTDKLELPEGKFLEGETFNLFHGHHYFDSYDREEVEAGNIMGEAVLERNAAVENRTGVTLNLVNTANPAAQGENRDIISSLILAGDTTYDAFVHVQHTGMPGLINEGMFLDWYELPHINFDKPWWYSNTIRDINFGGKVFAMTGDYNLASFSVTECLAFNNILISLFLTASGHTTSL